MGVPDAPEYEIEDNLDFLKYEIAFDKALEDGLRKQTRPQVSHFKKTGNGKLYRTCRKKLLSRTSQAMPRITGQEKSSPSITDGPQGPPYRFRCSADSLPDIRWKRQRQT